MSKCEHWRPSTGECYFDYCGVPGGCAWWQRTRAEKAEKEIARLHEANDGWREALGKVEKRLRALARGVLHIHETTDYAEMDARLQAALPLAQAALAGEEEKDP